jgi:hypothetical protein
MMAELNKRAAMGGRVVVVGVVGYFTVVAGLRTAGREKQRG